MSDSPLISVIVPVYNVEKYLRRCLKSICDQTYSNLEILCVNDGSTDGSAAILEEYAAKDARIQVFTQTNSGLSVARNTGLNHATGEWITGVDSDDYLDSDTYEYALRSRAEDDDIIIFGVCEERESEDIALRFQHDDRDYAQEPTRKLLLHTDVAFWNKLWKRSFVEKYKVRFPEGLWYEDAYFWFALAPFAKQIRNLTEKKHHYVLRNNSIMGATFGGCSRAIEQILITGRILDFYQQHPLPSHLVNMVIDLFIHHYMVARFHLPSSQHEHLLRTARKIAQQHGLLSRWPTALAFFRPIPGWKKLFVSHALKKSSYGIGPIKLLTVQCKNGTETARLLGIKLYKKPY